MRSSKGSRRVGSSWARLPASFRTRSSIPSSTRTCAKRWRTETRLFVADQLRQDRSVADLLLADYTFANDRLAQHYGIPNVYGSHYRPVKFNDRPPRRIARPGEHPVGDLVSQSHVGRDARTLAAGEHARRAAATAAARRAGAQGAWRRRAAEVAARADGSASQESRVRLLPSANGSARLYAREFRCGRQVAQRGRWRARRSGCVACRTARSFAGVEGLRDISGRAQGRLRQNAQRKLLAYAMGRGIEYYDQPAIRKIARDAAAKDYRWSSVILGVVNSTPFSAPAAEARREAAERPRAAVGPREQ